MIKISLACLADDADVCALAKRSPYTKGFLPFRHLFREIPDIYMQKEVAIVRRRGRIVAFVYFRHMRARSKPFSVIHYMGVAEEMRGSGLGKALVKWVLSRSPHKCVELSCECTNVAGDAFYTACGMYPVGEGVFKSTAGERPYIRWRITR